MNRQEFRSSLAALMKGYPQSRVQMPEIEPTWFALLKGYSQDEFKQTVRQALMSCKFFPNLSEVHTMAKEVRRQRLLDEDAARRREMDLVHQREEFISVDEVKELIKGICNTIDANAERMKRDRTQCRLLKTSA